MTQCTSQNGFTLLEILVSLLLLSLLITSVYAPQIKDEVDDYHQTLARTIAEDIYQIGTAAQGYATNFNGDWPDLSRSCAYAISTLKDDGYLVDANPEQSPMYRSAVSENEFPFEINQDQSRHIGQYYTACPEFPEGSGSHRHIYVRYVLAEVHRKYAAYIQSHLPATNILQNEHSQAIETAIPLPANIPAFDQLLPLSGERAMQGDLDMGGHALENADDVYLNTGQSLGSTLLSSAIVQGGTRVDKPSCPDAYMPSIVVTPVDFSHPSGSPLTKVRVWAEDYPSDNQWEVLSEVYTSGSLPQKVENSAVQMAVFIRCQL